MNGREMNAKFIFGENYILCMKQSMHAALLTKSIKSLTPFLLDLKSSRRYHKISFSRKMGLKVACNLNYLFRRREMFKTLTVVISRKKLDTCNKFAVC